jgi:hypothetical protein
LIVIRLIATIINNQLSIINKKEKIWWGNPPLAEKAPPYKDKGLERGGQ